MNNESQEVVIFSIIGAIIFLIIIYFLISYAVASGVREQTKLLQKQNDILLKMLNQQGISKQDLLDIFIGEKKDMWSTMKNNDETKK